MSEGSCNRGCTMYRRHLDECENPDTCRGCLPRRAEYGRLCWPCHRRLQLMFHDGDTVDRWLTGNMASGDGAAVEKEKIRGGGAESPAPIKVGVYDVRQQLRDHWATWVDWLVERESIRHAPRHTARADSEMLGRWQDRLEGWEEIGDLWEFTAELMSLAHALAPWRPVMRRVPTVPCPVCEEVNLVIFGGESDVTCLSCKTMIRSAHFQLWERILRDERPAS